MTLLTLIAAISGCADSAEPGTNSPNTTDQPISEFSDMEVGEGFHGYAQSSGADRDKDGVPTGSACFNVRRQVTPVQGSGFSTREQSFNEEQTSAAFYIYKEGQSNRNIHREFRQNFAGRYDVDTSELDDGIDTLFDTPSQEKTVLGIATRISTVILDAEVGEENELCPDPNNEECVSNACRSNPPESLQDFTNVCGTSYLDKRVMGGNVVLAAEIDTTQWTREQKLALDRAVRVGANPGSITVDQMMEGLRKRADKNEALYDRLDDIPFEIDTTGIWSPTDAQNYCQDQFLDAQGRITPLEWDDYMNCLRYNPDVSGGPYEGWREYLNLASYPDHDHDSFGEPMVDHFAPYDFESMYAECDLEEHYEAYRCYDRFDRDSAWTKDDESAIRKMVEAAKWKLNHPTRVRWPTMPSSGDDAQTKYADAVGYYDACMSDTDSSIETIRERAKVCEHAYQDEKYEHVCEVCNLPEDHDCSPETLRGKFDNLPEATLLPPAGQGTPNGGYPNYVAPKVHSFPNGTNESLGISEDSHLCYLSRLTGRMNADNAEARVFRNNGAWQAKATNGPNGHAVCVKKNIFFDTGNNDWLPFVTHSLSDDDTVANPPVPVTNMESVPYIAAITGFRGTMSNGGDQILVNHFQNDDEELQVGSNVGFNEGWAVNFGLEDPSNGHANDVGGTRKLLTSHVKYRRTEQLEMPADAGVCYLTRIHGQFDGVGEGARVFRRDGYWQLRIKSGCKSSGVLAGTCHTWRDIGAEATCFGFDQQQ
jgi:hypothetical protein